MSAEMHCGGSTPTPPGCAGTPEPSPWAVGPMTSQRAMERNTCLPPGPRVFTACKTCRRMPMPGAHCATPPAYKFLNSGLYAGRAGEVRSLLRSALLLPRRLVINSKSAEDDQTATIRVWHAGNHSITLDYGASLFWSLSGIPSVAAGSTPLGPPAPSG